jgi:uncharacterized membrane protein
MMTKSEIDRLVAGYLARLELALSDLPRSRSRQIIEEVSSHIAEGVAALETKDEAGVRSVLDRVGDPADIALEAGSSELRPRVRWADAVVPWLLLLGGFVFVVGWILGVGLLWSSSTWRVREKVLGTLVFPGGLCGSLFGLGMLVAGVPGSFQTCSGVPSSGQPVVMHCVTSGFTLAPAVGTLIIILALIPPVAVAVHLERVRRRA